MRPLYSDGPEQAAVADGFGSGASDFDFELRGGPLSHLHVSL